MNVGGNQHALSAYFRKAEAPKPVKPVGKIVPAQPLVQAPVAPPPEPSKSVQTSKLGPKEIVEEYFSRFPGFREAIESYGGGVPRVQALLQKAKDGDPEARDQVKYFFELFHGTPATAPTAATKSEKTEGKRPAPPPPSPDGSRSPGTP